MGKDKDKIILIKFCFNSKIYVNITFINGDGHDYGGAIHSEHGGKVYADTCIFKDNKANEKWRELISKKEENNFTNLEKNY